MQSDPRIYFPSRFDTVPDIVKEMNAASCLNHGYELISASKKSGAALHYIKCACGRKAQGSKAKKYGETHSSKPEDNTSTCDFKLVLKRDEKTNRFYMRQNGGHCLVHSSHLPEFKEDKEHGTRNIPTKHLKDAKDMLERNISNSVVQELIQLKTGMKLSDAAMTKLKHCMVMDKYKKDVDESMATTLVNMLDENPSVEFVAYYGTYSEATNKVRVRKRTRKRSRKKTKTKKKTSKVVSASTTTIGENVLEQKGSVHEELKGTDTTDTAPPSSQSISRPSSNANDGTKSTTNANVTPAKANDEDEECKFTVM